MKRYSGNKYAIKNGDSESFVSRIHHLFIAYKSLYEEEGLKSNFYLIVLMKKNIFDICINIDGNIIDICINEEKYP
jgi:hypothetical protein